MNEYKVISRLVKDIEEKFNVLSYAYKDGNEKKTYIYWNVCVDDYDVYTSGEYKEFAKQKHTVLNKLNIRSLFCYRSAFESILVDLAKNDNLIMNI